MTVSASSAKDDLHDQEYILNLYQDYHRLMYRTAQRYASSRSDCEDLVQESILRMIEKTAYIRALDRCVLPAYIVSTVRNTAINHLKRQSASRKHTDMLAQQQSTELPALDELSHLLALKEQLMNVMDGLEPDERFLLEGKYALGYSDDELAHYLKCKPGSVRMKLTRARRKAVQLLSRQEVDSNDPKR